MNFFVLNTKEDILKKVCAGCFGATLTFIVGKKHTMEVNGAPELVPTFFRISCFVFSRTKTFIQLWNYTRVSKGLLNFHFWVNHIPLSSASVVILVKVTQK